MTSKRTTRSRRVILLTREIARKWCNGELDDSPWKTPPLSTYTAIDLEAAKILGRDESERELSLDGLTTLTPSAAKALARYKGPLFLNGLRSLDSETEQILAKRISDGDGLGLTLLQGLERLESRKLAKTLAAAGQYFGELYFNRLRSLSPQAATVLVTADCSLGFGGNARFTPEVKEILANTPIGLKFFGRKHLTLKDVYGFGLDGEMHEGELILGDVTQLDADAAAELARYPGSAIIFTALEEITPSAAKSLAPYRGTLDLRHLNTCPPEAAVALAQRTGETRLQGHDAEAADGSLIVRLAQESVFNLGKVRQLTPELAATLSVAPILEFRNLRKLTPAAARVLAEQHHGSLLLDGLESLPDDVAAALSGHDGGVSLRNVRHISLAAARSLTTIKGFVSLGGLKILGPRLAAVLAGCSGSLMLDGVAELKPGVARKLQNHTGTLSMNGLSEISEETAKILAKKPNQKRMVRCGGSIAAVQHLLRTDANRCTLMFELNTGGAFG